MPVILRKLTWFEKAGDRFVGEAPLRGARLDVLRRAFNVAAPNPMYDCYPVTPAHGPLLQRLSGVKPDFARYEYFLEAEAAAPHGRRGVNRDAAAARPARAVMTTAAPRPHRGRPKLHA